MQLGRCTFQSLFGDAQKGHKVPAVYVNPMGDSFILSYWFIGQQVVIMDQPTANMDAESRKIFWDMVKKHQKGRVFIFTTDSMEEADMVADRKAILSHGVLKCCGSSLFLRNRFGKCPNCRKLCFA